MFKSVFSKYYAILSVLLISAMLGLGIVQMIFFNNYWIEDKRTQLTENSRQIAAFTGQLTSKVPHMPDTYVIATNSIEPMLNVMAQTIHAEVYIADADGQVLIYAPDNEQTTPVTTPLQPEYRQDHYFEVGTLGGMFPSMRYVATAPILMDSGEQIGYVVTAMPADGLLAYLKETGKTYLMSALIVLLILFVVIYLLTDRLVKPLKEMAAATRRFAEGDFSYRLKVKGKDDVAQLAAALNSMAVSLSSTENMSRSFVANISHELKTPMTTISGFVDGILDGTIPPDRQEHYLRIVSDEVRRLSRLVKSMLELSRIDNGTVALKPTTFDLTEVACRSLLSFEQRIEEKRVRIEGLGDCGRTPVTADYDLIGQVVYNLLDNAVKFVNEDGEITVRIYRENGRVYCAVRNSGAGLSPEEMPRVFERFYKTDRSRSLDKTGVGLGLYIVKTVINLHRGEIYVRSVQGEYCEFIFWLHDVAADPPSSKYGLPGKKGRNDL